MSPISRVVRTLTSPRDSLSSSLPLSIKSSISFFSPSATNSMSCRIVVLVLLTAFIAKSLVVVISVLPSVTTVFISCTPASFIAVNSVSALAYCSLKLIYACSVASL